MFYSYINMILFFFFFQAEDGIRDLTVTGVQTCALPIAREQPVDSPARGVHRTHARHVRPDRPPLGRRLSKDYSSAGSAGATRPGGGFGGGAKPSSESMGEAVRAAPRVSLVMCVFNGLGDTRACLESLRATTEPFRLVVMDNGSTDGTPEFFERFPYPYPLVFARRPANDGVIAALNRAWRLADTEVLCFLHNDTELSEPTWLARLLGALAEPGAGLTGLYGAQRLRADGRAVGRALVHSLLPTPTARSRLAP